MPQPTFVPAAQDLHVAELVLRIERQYGHAFNVVDGGKFYGVRYDMSSYPLIAAMIVYLKTGELPVEFRS